MAQQTFNLVPRRTKKLKRIVKDQFVTAIPDISLLGDTIQKIAASEITKEIRNDNPPTSIIVDNKKNKPFNQADYRILTNFANTDDMAYAAVTLIDTLQRYTRRFTGRARGSYQIWTSDSFKDGGTKAFQGTPGITTLKNIAKLLTGPQSRLIVVGPMVDYGRKLYWYPFSAKNQKYPGKSQERLPGRANKVAGYDASTGKTSFLKGIRDTNMADLVIPRVKAKHKGVLLRGRWVTVPSKNINGSNRWPGIAIGLKQKGRLN